jgi:Ca2+-binding EF-hand superfamily protein
MLLERRDVRCLGDIWIEMVNTVKSQKFSSLFDWFDQGRDGKLSHDDFQAMIGLFTKLVPEGDHANATGIRNAFEE